MRAWGRFCVCPRKSSYNCKTNFLNGQRVSRGLSALLLNIIRSKGHHQVKDTVSLKYEEASNLQKPNQCFVSYFFSNTKVSWRKQWEENGCIHFFKFLLSKHLVPHELGAAIIEPGLKAVLHHLTTAQQGAHRGPFPYRPSAFPGVAAALQCALIGRAPSPSSRATSADRRHLQPVEVQIISVSCSDFNRICII